jgi:hypothetical protein
LGAVSGCDRIPDSRSFKLQALGSLCPLPHASYLNRGRLIRLRGGDKLVLSRGSQLRSESEESIFQRIRRGPIVGGGWERCSEK